MAPGICFDCSPLLVRSAGVKTYLYHLVRSLRALYPESVGTFLNPGARGLIHGGGFGSHPGRTVALQALRMMPRGMSTKFAPRCGVLHVSNLLGPKLMSAGRRRHAISATIHDLTAWTVPECHTGRGVQADKDFAAAVWGQAHGLIAVSEHSRSDAIRILGVKPDRIRVIYPGVAEEYFEAAAEQRAKPYFLFVGTIEPRKNLDTLLTAWMSLSAEFRTEFEFLVVGMPGWKSERTLARLRHLSSADSGVRYLGYLPESRLPGLTAGARALVYPSLYEGFGLPVAQAMAAGCPVITAGVSSLPEITGGAALLIDPGSSAELAAAIRKMGESTATGSNLRRAGKDRARRFHWQDSARATFEYLDSLRPA